MIALKITPQLGTLTEANPFLYWYMSTNSTYQHVQATAELSPWYYFQETYSKNVYHRYLELSSTDAKYFESLVILHVANGTFPLSVTVRLHV